MLFRHFWRRDAPSRSGWSTRRDIKLHTLTDNHYLTEPQYQRCVALVCEIQALYDGVRSYLERNGLDPALFLPGNEWADIVPSRGLIFSTDYTFINFLRLNAPFTGYHLPILDRLDNRRFPGDGGEEFVAKLYRDGVPSDIGDNLHKRMNMIERLLPDLPVYEAVVRDVPSPYVVAIPRIMGEIGLEVGGVLFNPDATILQSRINGLLSSGVIDKLNARIADRGRARVLEVGAGYGGLAAALKSIFGSALDYVVSDLPSSLYYSTLYLTTLADGEGCYLIGPGASVPESFNYLFVSNHLLEELAGNLEPVDLAINTMSFPEMSPAQVRYYADYFRRVLRPDGVVFEENGVIKPHHTDCVSIFASVFPFREEVKSPFGSQRLWSMQYPTDERL
jgi:hypothetical protein